ncbi:replication-associated recombination protein A [Acetonema longum]|uniref:Replication-associated recombination protein A n=1 Tax=Acetonema longum DSM 6540 TaxID=1009370 RepID=F7NPN4_9FIRM|nr:replication-associated recombination protein A [Acetonema longum]EGO62001.1 recombination factor protein RarA [Acetonema longum DSM 6540]
MDLFTEANRTDNEKGAPLASRMRPRNLSEFSGQKGILGPGKFLRQMIEAGSVPSMILFGPPGTGKTTLATLLADRVGADFVRVNAVASGTAEIRKLIDAAKERLALYRRRTILFIDEIHRFNKGQQDVLLPYVEDGSVTLIGATTENPYFEINSPLLSRMRVVRLRSLMAEDLVSILKSALTDKERGLGALSVAADEGILQAIAEFAAGDARSALNLLEQAAALAQDSPERKLTKDHLELIVGEMMQRYDKTGDQHYDVASAFIKSMRGSDPDAALHYLARMIAAGEDVRFIARRIVICASEDVGNADPMALVVASSGAQAVQLVGMPEAGLILSQMVAYIAAAPKSNAACVAIDKALQDVKTKDCGPVPAHLRDAHYRGASQLGHGVNYLYPHDFPGAYVHQQYLPDKLTGTIYYHPSNRGFESKMAEQLPAKNTVEKK